MARKEPLTILCLASYEKGFDFIRECKERGCRVLLLTLESLKDKPWPRDCIDEVFLMPTFQEIDWIVNTVSYYARRFPIDRIVPMDDYDVDRAAALREHLRCPGMGESRARFYRDKLAMRVQAQDNGVPVPDFVHVLNYDRIKEYMARVPPPWMLKPRLEAAARGIQKIHHADELWPKLDELGDRQSYFLLERFIKGQVYHVDSLTHFGQNVMVEPHRYTTPPFEVAHGGGVFSSRTIEHGSKEEKTLKDVHSQVLKALQCQTGVSHSEFIRSDEDGKVYFLETSARVAGAFLANMIEASTGINLWREWAKMVIDGDNRTYKVPERRHDYGGLVITLSKQQCPDTSGYVDPEIAFRVKLDHHAGLVLRSPDLKRVDQLISEYIGRFKKDFLATMPGDNTMEG